MLVTSGGKAIRFHEEQVRPMGRDAAGVRGVRLGEGQRVIALLVLGEGYVLTASENGYGKLTSLEDFPGHGRGAQGVIVDAMSALITASLHPRLESTRFSLKGVSIVRA